MAAYLIGIDVGTQGTKTCLYREDGTNIASAFEPSRLIEPQPGAMEQDPEEMYGSVLRTVSQVMEQGRVAPQDVAALCMDGQMAGILGIDDAFQATTPYDSWLDTRCEPEIHLMRERMAERITAVTGAPVSYAHGPKVLHWKRCFPDIYRKTRKFVLPVTYIAGRLCGLRAEDAWIDQTCLHFSGFGNAKNLCWSDELLEAFDVDGAKMPRILAPWEMVGTLTAEAASQCGLTAGTPVCAGAGDQAATAFGAGIVRSGLAFDVAGTASVFSVCTDTYTPDTENQTILYARSVLPELWIPLAYVGGGGLCLRWARDTLDGSENGYDRLNTEAASVPPGCEGLMFVPHFNGRVCPNDPLVRGAYLGLGCRHTRAHMYRAVMESIGYEYAGYAEILRQTARPDTVFVIGGGSRSDLFNQIKADILNIRYARLDTADTGTWGCAMLAGYAVGIYNDLAEVSARHVRITGEYLPNVETHRLYAHSCSIYPESIRALRSYYHMA